MSEDNKLIAKALSTMTLAQIECYLNNVDKLEKVLYAPPTVDEVCKALSEYYGKKVTFKENVFWYITIMYGNEQWVREVSLKDLSKDNRGDLITMVGKFYENLEENLNV